MYQKFLIRPAILLALDRIFFSEISNNTFLEKNGNLTKQ